VAKVAMQQDAPLATW